MRLVVLSHLVESYSVKRLADTAAARGHEASIVDYLDCSMSIATRRPKLLVNSGPLVDVDAVIPRIGAGRTYYGTAVVRQFEMRGVFCANKSLAITRSRDKLRSLQILAKQGVAMPVTAIAGQTQESRDLIKLVNGPPVIVKLIEGTQGVGVVLAETQQAAESVIDAFRSMGSNILVQEFIRESAGVDVRCFVVGGKVVASMERTAAKGEFRSNIHRGGTGKRVKLAPDERALAIAATKAMGLNIAGVDLVRSNHGALVLEVNSSPGLEGIETATNKDVAGAIVDYVEKHVERGATGDRVGH